LDSLHISMVLTVHIGCIGVLAVFSIGDMIVYNRRKRAIYFAEEERTQARILENARLAVAEGTATAAQSALVSGIAEEEILMQQKKAERKAPSRLLWWMHGEWKEDKEIAEQRRLAVEELKKHEMTGGNGVGIVDAVREAGQKLSSSTSPSTPIVGGPLDNTAEKATQKVEQTSKGWLGWMMGGSKKE
jgi:hypothetical protein